MRWRYEELELALQGELGHFRSLVCFENASNFLSPKRKGRKNGIDRSPTRIGLAIFDRKWPIQWLPIFNHLLFLFWISELDLSNQTPKRFKKKPCIEVILDQSDGHTILRQAFGKIVMSNKGAGQGQNGVLSHRDDTEWKMTDSNKRIRFYFSVARIFV